ncbi:hypothetical protein CANARDRAFT_196971 [[Candida] arabinofermentans NRRL YB-2248]|uniref:Uncharacterized protein n=1 Tax=[Candida] arabinofermentans NRRL YB-2248 TaxID=983967 RepID=A0A1E4T339_9ASCO|nr:hypothetical protein CANARDRAFT_196971 [[Candida] arabinofermentans NRRL YB-2248]
MSFIPQSNDDDDNDKEQQQQLQLQLQHQHQHQHQNQNQQQHEEIDQFLPMDESQLIENQNLSDPELFNILKNKDMLNYLKPALHILFKNISTPSIISPSSALIRNLDDTGKLFLDHYMSYIVNVITVCNNNESNFFVNYFLRLANTDEAVLMGIVAWGGMFLLGSQDESARKYFYKSLNMVNSKLKKKNLSNEDYMIILSAYIVMMGSEISTGDVKYWYHLFLQFKDVLTNYGGLPKFVENNKHSNEGKWLISNFFFHDVMGTRTISAGTHLDMKIYKNIFIKDKWLETDNYGMDPFQGSSHELFLILGDIINKRRDVKNIQMRIHLLQKSIYESEIKKLTKTVSEYQTKLFNELESEVVNCKPMISQLTELHDDPQSLELHLTLFELLQVTLQIYIRLSFTTQDFSNSEIQKLRILANDLFDIVKGTHLQPSLCLPMMIIGVLCLDDQSRNEMELRYENYVSGYEVKNIRRCYDVIKECWKLTDEKIMNGEVPFVDWCDVVEDFGWNFCFS